jgi:hypothetical protein
MYATNEKGRIYHLVKREAETLCGLRVSQLIEGKGLALRLIRSHPDGMNLCKHCARIEQEEEKTG